MLLGAIEAGGTKFICATGNENGEILEKIEFPTETPEITIKKVIKFFKDKKIEKMGIGTFGPADLDKSSKTYGHITNTPKPHWENFDFVGGIKKHFNIPIVFDTDVNGAALGEAVFGCGKDEELDSLLYMTVGTGVGVGIYNNNSLVHGMLHPEAGHLLVRRHPEDRYKGNCSFHNDCLEGMASGPAIEKRWNEKAYNLDSTHKAWEFEAYYIAQGLVNYILTVSPKKIVLGGGVMKQSHLFKIIRKNVQELLNGYVSHKNLLEEIEKYIIFPQLEGEAGIVGALALAIYG